MFRCLPENLVGFTRLRISRELNLTAHIFHTLDGIYGSRYSVYYREDVVRAAFNARETANACRLVFDWVRRRTFLGNELFRSRTLLSAFAISFSFWAPRPITDCSTVVGARFATAITTSPTTEKNPNQGIRHPYQTKLRITPATSRCGTFRKSAYIRGR